MGVVLPLPCALCMANMLMVMICSMFVQPSREGPCWRSVLNSCKTRLATAGNDSILGRENTGEHTNQGIFTAFSLRCVSIERKKLPSMRHHSPHFSEELPMCMQETQNEPLIELWGKKWAKTKIKLLLIILVIISSG